MSKKNKQQANVVEIEANPRAVTGGNSDSLEALMSDIDALAIRGVSFVDDAVALWRRACTYVAQFGDANPIASLHNAIGYTGKKGMVTKFKQATMQAIRFEYFERPDGKAGYRKARKKDVVAIHDMECWELGFMAWSPAPVEREEWTLEEAMRKAIKRVAKEGKLSEADARTLVLDTVKTVALKPIVTPEPVVATPPPPPVGGQQAHDESEAA